jgi:DNA-binding GntR family transcriptional regulator
LVRIASRSALSVPRLSPAELDRLDDALERMDELAGVDVAEWEVVHAGFHRLLAGHAGERLQRLSEQCVEYAERYRRVYVTTQPRAWSVGAAEHREIVEACRARDAPLAAARLARHLSRTALSVLM